MSKMKKHTLTLQFGRKHADLSLMLVKHDLHVFLWDSSISDRCDNGWTGLSVMRWCCMISRTRCVIIGYTSSWPSGLCRPRFSLNAGNRAQTRSLLRRNVRGPPRKPDPATSGRRAAGERSAAAIKASDHCKPL